MTDKHHPTNRCSAPCFLHPRTPIIKGSFMSTLCRCSLPGSLHCTQALRPHSPCVLREGSSSLVSFMHTSTLPAQTPVSALTYISVVCLLHPAGTSRNSSRLIRLSLPPSRHVLRCSFLTPSTTVQQEQKLVGRSTAANRSASPICSLQVC
jgi:hypothetical protein